MKYVKTIALLLLSMSLFCQKQTLYVGTFTTRTSEGVYSYTFDPKTGDLTTLSSTTKYNNPGFLALSPNKKNLYATSKEPGGAVNAFAVEKDGKLRFLNTQSSGGENPCHITTDRTGKWVLVGNYNAGTLSVLPVNADGSLGKAVQTIAHEGKSIHPERQDKAHVHQIVISDDNRTVFVPDLGMDKIMVYTFDQNLGQLTANTPIVVKAGAGPRHFELHPSGKFGYVVQELNNTVTAFRYNQQKWEEIQTISTLPEGFTEKSYAADIHVSADGRFLYASNRGHDSIVCYAIDPKGYLQAIQHQLVIGKWPRNFTLDPTNNFLLVANQESDNVTVFRRDKTSGKLTFTGKEAKVSMPVCLKFL